MSYAQQQTSHPAEPSIRLVGLEQAPLVVIDDFSADPERLVHHAATQCSFLPVKRNNYPGTRASAPKDYVDEVLLKVEELVRAVFGFQDLALNGGRCNFSLVTTRPEQLRPLQRMPHFDLPDVYQLAVLHYLCPTERGGTSFYRHRSTGYESITLERFDTYKAKIHAEINATGLPPAYIVGDTPLFEHIESVDARFNRMVIYRSVNLHSVDIRRDFGFEPDVRKGRLTLNTFLRFGPRAETLHH
jgi:hypothetical protein